MDNKEQRMVEAAREGRHLAQSTDFTPQQLADRAGLYDTSDERDAFVSAYYGERRRMKNEHSDQG